MISVVELLLQSLLKVEMTLSDTLIWVHFCIYFSECISEKRFKNKNKTYFCHYDKFGFYEQGSMGEHKKV